MKIHKPINMKTSKIYLGLASLLIAGSLTFTSCRKKEKTQPQDPDTEQSTATDNNLAENHANDIDAMGSQVCDTYTLSTYRTNGLASGQEALALSPTATVTVVGKVVTIDFGSIGCVGADGKTRTGKLIYDYSASPASATRYRHFGFKMSVTSQSYVVDGTQVNIINKTVTNTTPLSTPTGTNPGTNLTWSVTANISIVKAGNGGTISWSCNRTKELTTTYWPCYVDQATPINWLQAKVKLNGSASGTNAKGETFTAVAHDLVRDFTCHPDAHPHHCPFVSGTISYTPGNRPTRLIDFGNGACDLSATVLINGQTFVVNLP